MTRPVILYDNRLADAVPVASGTATGFDVLNLRDWAPYTFWQPDALPATVTADAASLAWDFTNSAEGWNVNGGTIVINPTTVTLTSTTNDLFFRSPVLEFDGGTHRYVVARIKRIAGATWDGRLLYQTAKHFEGLSFFKDIADPTGGVPGGWVIAVWDMHDLTAGGDDWKKGTITRFRLDFSLATAHEFEIDWIAVMPKRSADYALLWGHDLGSRGVTVALEGSDDNSTFTQVATAAPAGDDPLALYFAAAEYRWWRLNFTEGFASSAPTVAIAAIGAMLEVPTTLAAGFDPTKRDPRGQFNRSTAGHPLSRVVEFEEWRESLKLPLLPWAWIRATWAPAWVAHLRGTPWAFAWDRTGHPGELHLVSCDGGYKTPHRTGGLVDLSVDVIGLAL